MHVRAKQQSRLQAHLEYHLRVPLGREVQRIDDDSLRTMFDTTIEAIRVLVARRLRVVRDEGRG